MPGLKCCAKTKQNKHSRIHLKKNRVAVFVVVNKLELKMQTKAK